MYYCILILLQLFLLHHDTNVEACGGVTNLPLQMGTPTTNTKTGNKVYSDSNVNTLARRLVTDITGITLDYAKILADDALNIEENYEISYSFFITQGTARMSQFKIKSEILKSKVHMSWQILAATVSYTAQRDVSTKRGRRRWLRRGRRRCSRQIQPRGVTKNEIQRIQSSLTAVLKRVGTKSAVFGFKRIHSIKPGMKQLPVSCPAWRPSVNVPMSRSCSHPK